MEQPITVGCLEGFDWLLHSFIEVNFSQLTDSNQIFRNDFVCLYYHLNKISIQINECIVFFPMISCNELSITLSTLWCYQRTSTAIEERSGKKIWEKNFALIEFSWNFVQVYVNANVVIPESMVVVHWSKLSQSIIFIEKIIFFALVSVRIWRVPVFYSWAIVDNVCIKSLKEQQFNWACIK